MCDFLKVSARVRTCAGACARTRTYYIGHADALHMAQDTYKAVLLSASSIPIDERTIAYLYGPRRCADALKDAGRMEDLCTKASQLLGRPHKTLDPVILSQQIVHVQYDCPDSLYYNIIRQFVWTGLWGKTAGEAEAMYYRFVQDERWYQHPDWREARRILTRICAVRTVVDLREGRTVRVLAHDPDRYPSQNRRERPLQAFRVSRGMGVPSAPQNSAESILVDSRPFHETV